jgi:hypothetical protein
MKEEFPESVGVAHAPGKAGWNDHLLRNARVERNMTYPAGEEFLHEREHVFPGRIGRKRYGQYPNSWGRRGDGSGSRSGTCS